MSKKYVRQKQSQPKHSHYSSVQPILSSPQVPTSFSSRPEWRGTGYQKPKKRAPPKVVSKFEREKELEIPSLVSSELQQKLLDVIRNTFPLCTEEYEALRPVLTVVKAHVDAGDLQGREFEKQEMREAFLVRWGPERALVLAALLTDWAECSFREEALFERLRTGDFPLNVMSFGNGAGVMIALSALLRQIQPDTARVAHMSEGADSQVEGERRLQVEGQRRPQPRVALQLVQGPSNWATEIDSLLTALLAPPALSKYASAAAKAAARPFLAPGSLALHHHSHDVLEDELKTQELAVSAGKRPCLITLCFSLRNMQIASVAKTIKFLMSLTKAAPKESLILVVDEMESTDAEGDSGGEKKYPLRFLLDLALLGKGVLHREEEKDSEGEAGRPEAAWERLVGDEERIFKIDPGLQYPLSLGKVRVQAHLFKRR